MTAPKVADVPLAKLTPAPWNPRTIRDERFKNLCESIQADPEFLWRRPILAMADGTIYAGNMRYRAATHLGLKAVPAIVEDVPEKLAKERALRDNAQWGDWHEDQLAEMVYQMAADGSDVKLLGIEDDELARLLGLTGAGGNEGLTDPDEVPENVPTRSKPGDLWLLGEHRVLCGDATKADDVARLMNGARAVLMNTDPPYGVAYTDETRVAAERAHGRPQRMPKWEDGIENDERTGEDIQPFLEDVFRVAVVQALRPDAAWYLWHAQMTQAFFAAAAAAAALLLHRQIIWVKPSLLFGFGDYHWRHELCFYGWVQGNRPPFYGERNQTSVWELTHDTANGDRVHPTQKPVELFAIPIRNHVRSGEVVYEPFLGSGSQLIAAERFGARCYGLEIEPKYVDVIVQRWENFTGKTAVLA